MDKVYLIIKQMDKIVNLLFSQIYLDKEIKIMALCSQI